MKKTWQISVAPQLFSTRSELLLTCVIYHNWPRLFEIYQDSPTHMSLVNGGHLEFAIVLRILTVTRDLNNNKLNNVFKPFFLQSMASLKCIQHLYFSSSQTKFLWLIFYSWINFSRSMFFQLTWSSSERHSSRLHKYTWSIQFPCFY